MIRIAIDPGASTPGAAAWGTDRVDGVIVWTWAAQSVAVRDARTGDLLARVSSLRGCAEIGIVGLLPPASALAIEGLYQPSGAYQRRRSSLGSILVLAEHVGALIAAFRAGGLPPDPVSRPTAIEWRPRVGIPARTEARRAGGLAIEIAERRLGLRFRGGAESQEAAAEAALIWLSTWGIP